MGDAQVAYYVMLKWTRVAASETHELLFRPSRTRFPEHHNGATPSPHQPPTLIFSSLFHCDRHYRVRRSTASDYPLTPGKPAGATAQLHTLLPTSATTAPSLTTAADDHPTNTRPYVVPATYNTMVGLTSAAGVVGFLSEPDPALRSFALQRLNEEIDLLWPEVAVSVSQM